jgi:hypothetical protein
MTPARAFAATLPLVLLLMGAAPEPAAVTGAACYTADGALLPPEGYREWIFLTSSLDMNYQEGASTDGASEFDNVFVDPAAWRTFKATGHWPDGTVLVKEDRGGSTKGSINKSGKFQTEELMGLEVHVHDAKRFPGGWGFFAFGDQTPAKMIPASASCYACHQAHGAVDSTFTQFYPTAKPIAVKAGSFQDR